MTDRALSVAWPPPVEGLPLELTPQQELACSLRILAREGCSENMAGHITVTQEGSDNLWVNPWGKWWSEVSASDICLVDLDGQVLEGKWGVTPAIFIHTELHRNRSDARVVVHNHPYYVTVLAAVGLLPEALHQTVALFHEDMCWVDQYDGEVVDAPSGQILADRIGDRAVAMLANHGVVVTADSIGLATYRTQAFERACRLTVDARTMGAERRQIPGDVQGPMRTALVERAAEVYWHGAVRQLIRDEPDVLD